MESEGNCQVISSQKQVLIFDCGSQGKSKNKRIIEKIVKICKGKEVTLIISHPHQDHFNLLNKIFFELILKKSRISKVIIGGNESFALEKMKLKENNFEGGEKEEFSIVEHLQNKEISVLFTWLCKTENLEMLENEFALGDLRWRIISPIMIKIPSRLSESQMNDPNLMCIMIKLYP